MLKLTDNPFTIDDDCRQASCCFDIAAGIEEALQQYRLVLPPQLAAAVPKRKAEFIAGRYCAQLALGQLGHHDHNNIDIGPRRQPLWPDGLTGSITHAHGYASAVVARGNRIRAIGIDTERLMAPGTALDLARQILTPDEQRDALLNPLFPPAYHLTLVFSAKESLYKCLFPLVQRFFGFHSARVDPLPGATWAEGSFRFELLEDLGAGFSRGYCGLGSYRIVADLVHTAVSIRA